MDDRRIRIEELAFFVGSSAQTINNWYRWKKLNPNHELAKLLPDFEQDGDRQIRYWKQSDVNSVIEFKRTIPRGKNGILGEITQKYKHKEEN